MATNENKPAESKTYKQQAGDFYNRQYDSWVPWMEDKYLQWFTKDNKASYATKRTSPLLSINSMWWEVFRFEMIVLVNVDR